MISRTFGYSASASRLVICVREAEIVRHIFRAYAGRESRLQICSALNRAGIPSPGHHRGRDAGCWFASHLYNGRGKRSAILGNEIYAGRLIFNPGLLRDYPASEWVIQDAPSLCIIGEQLWNAVQARLEAEQCTGRDQTGENA